MAGASTHVATTLAFVKSDLTRATEKPYRLLHDPQPRLPRTNCQAQSQSGITVREMRPSRGDYTLERNGFEVVDLNCVLATDDLYDDEAVKTVWYRKLREMCQQRFGAKSVEILEHDVYISLASQPLRLHSDSAFAARSENSTCNSLFQLAINPNICNRPASFTSVRAEVVTCNGMHVSRKDFTSESALLMSQQGLRIDPSEYGRVQIYK